MSHPESPSSYSPPAVTDHGTLRTLTAATHLAAIGVGDPSAGFGDLSFSGDNGQPGGSGPGGSGAPPAATPATASEASVSSSGGLVSPAPSAGVTHVAGSLDGGGSATPPDLSSGVAGVTGHSGAEGGEGGGGPAGAGPTGELPSGGVAGGRLPFTGFAAGTVAAMGSGLTAAGVALRRFANRA